MNSFCLSMSLVLQNQGWPISLNEFAPWSVRINVDISFLATISIACDLFNRRFNEWYFNLLEWMRNITIFFNALLFFIFRVVAFYLLSKIMSHFPVLLRIIFTWKIAFIILRLNSGILFFDNFLHCQKSEQLRIFLKIRHRLSF